MNTSSKRILIVDDDPSVRSVLRQDLEDCGYGVDIADNGETAMKAIEQGPIPDIVITDLIMPGRDGFDTIAEITRSYPDIKVIAISGGGGRKVANNFEKAKSLGSHAIFQKPFSLIDLENLIETLTRR